MYIYIYIYIYIFSYLLTYFLTEWFIELHFVADKWHLNYYSLFRSLYWFHWKCFQAADADRDGQEQIKCRLYVLNVKTDTLIV